MNDEVSVYSGIRPEPIMSVSWQSVIENIRSEKYRDNIEKCRLIKDPIEYRTKKTKLPSVTFAGVFSHRNNQNIVKPTGFIIPDLDHLADMESVFHSLIQDENIWFVFRSPSNEGMKCGIRATGITSDEEHKILYAAVERYFKDTYSIRIDPACKDISRLTFVSSDKDLFVNPAPLMFDVPGWTRKPEQHFYHPVSTSNGWKSIYGNKVLESCCKEIAESEKGQQHGTRLRKSRLIGGFIASGFIDELVALSELEQAVVLSGAVRVQDAMKTIQDGIRFGKAEPIYLEERPITAKPQDISFYCDPYECFEDSQQNQQSKQSKQESAESAEVSRSKQEVSVSLNYDKEKTDQFQNKKPHNLAAHIVEWIKDSGGSFTVDQIDREFCLTTRTEKNNRSKCLSVCVEKKIINKDKRIKGKYNVIDSELSVIDIHNITETPFNIFLPFNLHESVSTPQKSIIVIAGSSNAGKSCLILNTLKLNLSQEYKKLYLISEMRDGEYVDRLRSFKDIKFDDWDNIVAAERSYDFNGAIEHHNKNGLTCIDYLEDVDGEFHKIPSDIRYIYEALDRGVAIIAIQKRTDLEFGRGGQGTMEKARLYLTVDTICVGETSVICALKILKLKRYIGKNLQGHEIHFKIHSGSKIEALTGWMKSEPGLRERCKLEYEAANYEQYSSKKDSYVYRFRLKNGEIKGINQRDLNRWIESFPYVKVEDFCKRHSDKSFTQESYLTDRWFYQLGGTLKKENDKKTPCDTKDDPSIEF